MVAHGLAISLSEATVPVPFVKFGKGKIQIDAKSIVSLPAPGVRLVLEGHLEDAGLVVGQLPSGGLVLACGHIFPC